MELVALRPGHVHAEVERHVQQSRRRKPKILRLHALKASLKQSRSHEQHATQSDLQPDQHCPQWRARRRPTLVTRFERRDKIATASLHERNAAGNDTRGRRHRDRGRENTWVDDSLRWRDTRE
jgi:hypothetical protein